MSRSELVLEVNNKEFTGWSSVSVTRSLEQCTGSFNLGLTMDKGGKQVDAINKGDKCVIVFKTDYGPVSRIPIMEGYINRKSSGVTATEVSLAVSGEDVTQDLVECSAITTSNGWTAATLIKICKDLAKPYDIGVEDYTDSEKVFKNYKIQDGETCFDVIERAARQEGVLPISNRFGNLVLTYSAEADGPISKDLYEGGENANVLELNLDEDIADRFSEYTFKGQNSGDGKAWGANTTRLVKKATDSGVKRHRPTVILSEGKTDAQRLQNRANWEAQVRAGRSAMWTARVASWFIDPPEMTSTIRPWEINALVNLKSVEYDYSGVLLVTGITFSLTADEGATTTLELRDPATYKKDPTDSAV